jgi:hypothetical protein
MSMCMRQYEEPQWRNHLSRQRSDECIVQDAAAYTKSSTESELVGLSDQLPQVLCGACSYNQSTIALVAKKGRSTFSRTRHIAIRYFYEKNRVHTRGRGIV